MKTREEIIDIYLNQYSNDIAVRKNDLHRQHHVVNLAVFGGNNADSAVSEESAYG